MICFQILYLWYSVTSKSGSSSSRCSLWFAFKFCIFDILLHQLSILMVSEPCCDLLSNFVSLIFCYITAMLRFAAMLVVICFQILYLWYSVTSKFASEASPYMLWFAFKFCIFDILLHPVHLSTVVHPSCDLLSNFVSLIFCYISCVDWKRRVMLWFAFKFCIFDILLHRACQCTLST